ncbi:hypothetical protein [uncultured Paraglaciecola sp.]|nr:hypothetical protein [uncultured Paraglaciecola sp.]
MAYEYGAQFGLPVSDVLKLPVDEYTTGLVAYRKIRGELVEDNGY